MLFKYKGYDKNGLKLNSSIEADDLALAKLKLKSKKIIITSISSNSFGIFTNIFKKSKSKISPLVLSTLSRDLSIYLDSGISLLNAIKLINERYKKDKVLAPFFESIVTFLDEGNNLFTALDMQTVIELPDFYLQSIKISEDGGILKDVLIELSEYLKEQYTLSKQISQAMMYPSIIVIIAILMVGFMLSFVVPQITAIFDKNGQELPQITILVINAGDFITENYQNMIAVIFLMIVSFSYMMKNSYSFKRNFNAISLKVPFIGSIIEISELARFSYMNAILIKSGVPVVQAFKMGANILNNLVLKELFLDASQKVVEGEKLSTILSNSKTYAIDVAFIQAIAIGEETSQLNRVLDNLAQLYSTTNKDKISSFLSILEPLLMVFVGLSIGFIIIATMLPIVSMSI
jgi:general secretion pathway protein F/type IV pilus assembly protein PilC